MINKTLLWYLSHLLRAVHHRHGRLKRQTSRKLSHITKENKGIELNETKNLITFVLVSGYVGLCYL